MISRLFSKLNFKDHDSIVVLDAPASFETELSVLDGVEIHRSLAKGDRVKFALAFATTQRELDAATLALTPAADGDAILWFAYPKGTSKRYTCDFNRDTGFALLGQCGYEGVRMVAIDEDWSALRFRRAEYVKSLKRDPSRAISRSGRSRTSPPREAP